MAALGVLGIASLFGQTTQGLISGSIVNSVTGRPIAGASVTYTSETLAATGTLKSDAAGYYFLPLLSAGTYRSGPRPMDTSRRNCNSSNCRSPAASRSISSCGR